MAEPPQPLAEQPTDAAVAATPSVLARFEFESGRSNEGSKILMVEWETEGFSHCSRKGDWQVSWPGKGNVLPAEASAEEIKAEGGESRRRLFFLLPPGVTVPPTLTLLHSPGPEEPGKEIKWQVNALPAIFPPELGASRQAAGTKGVLHTQWATARLRTLQREIEHESENNIEGIGLEMALREREWIESSFGIGSSTARVVAPTPPANPPPTSPTSPRTPLSPGGSRLSEKLKGLRLGTSARELSNQATDSNSRENNQLSSFGESERTAIQGPTTAILGPTTAKPSNNPPAVYPVRAFSGHSPPAAVRQQQRENSSLNSAAGCGVTEVAQGDELFAVAMSPRSPEMTMSPFSQLKTTMSRG